MGCYPLSSGIVSNAKNLNAIISEVKEAKYSERHGRLIDNDKDGSMEIKRKKVISNYVKYKNINLRKCR